MSALEPLGDRIPDFARDLKLNLEAILAGGPLTTAQRWGVAVAAAIAGRNAELRGAIVEAARAGLSSAGLDEAAVTAVLEDAAAAAALMGMNNVYYRFRHFIGKESYQRKPARLRMNRLVKPATNRLDFELFSMAVSAVNGCEACVRAHEKVVVEGGSHGEPLTEDQVHDAVRIAAVVQGTAIALEAGRALGAE